MRINLIPQLILILLAIVLFTSCEKKTSFTGTVESPNKEPIDGATVKVNGKETTTRKGKFSIDVSVARRYVVTVKKPGFSLYSKVHNEGLKERKIVLQQATVKDFPASAPIDLADTLNRPRPEIGFENSTNPLAAVPRVYNAEGNLISFGWPASMQNEMDNFNSISAPINGFRVQIPANSLTATGSVSVAVTTINIFESTAMPGDYGAMFQEQYGYMLSYGAGVVDVYQGSKEVQLTKGMTATISIPVDSSFLLSKEPIPESIPFLVYDEDNAIWKQEGVGLYDKRTNSYLAQTSHFSAFNFDMEKTNPSCAAFDFNVTSFITAASNPLGRAVVEVYSSPSYHPQFGACFDTSAHPCPGSGYTFGNFKSGDCGVNDSLFAIKNIPNNSPLAFVVKTISVMPDPGSVQLFTNYTTVNNVAVIYTGGPATGLGPANEPSCDYTSSNNCVKPPAFVWTSAASPQLEIVGCATPAGANYDIKLFWIFKYTTPGDPDNQMFLYQRTDPAGGDCSDDLTQPPILAQWTNRTASITSPDSFVYNYELPGFSGLTPQHFKVRIIDGDVANVKEVCVVLNVTGGVANCATDILP